MTISDQLYPKVVAFKEVIEAVLGEHLAFGTYIELVLEEGIEAILGDLLALSDHQALVRSFYELSSRHPMQGFEHVAERIRAGELPAGGHRIHGRKLGSARRTPRGAAQNRLRGSSQARVAPPGTLRGGSRGARVPELGRRIIADTLEVARAGVDHAATVVASNPVVLTPREREILVLLASGARNVDIASRLSLTINSVKFHVANIYSKLGVHSRTEAAVFAVTSRLIPTDPRDTRLSL